MHNQELHRSADSVRRLVEEANKKSGEIGSSIAKISEAEAQLASLASGIEVFAATQDNAIKGHTAKLEQLTTETGNALQGIDGKPASS